MKGAAAIMFWHRGSELSRMRTSTFMVAGRDVKVQAKCGDICEGWKQGADSNWKLVT